MSICYYISLTGACELRIRDPKMGCKSRKKGDMCGLSETHAHLSMPAKPRVRDKL